MSSIDHAASSYDPACRTHAGARVSSADRVRDVIRMIAVVLGAATLAGCAQSSGVSQRSSAVARDASAVHGRTAFLPVKERVAAKRKYSQFASSRKDAANATSASQGVASFYSEGKQTASGERFDARELTAAHPTLPFGTKLRVTDVNSGRSVTVRVNDRGPYVPGRVVDVSHSAAQELGMVGKGVANVRLDVVQ
ncbi:MAG: septal ring lytic transglycosylase RlpA family protein [Bradyrhizobium sp.]|nr:septal ring lytic transglycosylase RlpA family protein [Bradyrhizobium sp.]